MQPAFRYATVAQVKGRIAGEILTAGNVTDAEILERIEAASAMVNEWTRQVFQPIAEISRISARGDRLVYHPQRHPVLKLLTLALIDNRTTGKFQGMNRIIPGLEHFPELRNRRVFQQDPYGLYSSSDIAWEPGKRTVEMISLIGGFPRGFYNVEMTGWWGWQEGLKILETTLLDDIPFEPDEDEDVVVPITQSIRVASVLDATTGNFIQVGDTIVIDLQKPEGALVPTAFVPSIVQAIAQADPEGYNLTIDLLPDYPFIISAGTTVRCFGRVPAALSDVVQFLTVNLVKKLSADRSNDAAASAAADGQLKSESVDNYSYSLGGQGGGDTGGGGIGTLTGSARMDTVLRQFVQPAATIRVI